MFTYEAGFAVRNPVETARRTEESTAMRSETAENLLVVRKAKWSGACLHCTGAW